MFYLQNQFGKFYTGRAGEGWIGNNGDAFAYATRAEAERKAANFNRVSALHHQTFEVVEA